MVRSLEINVSAFILISASLLPLMADQKSMPASQVDAFEVVGIETRTSNAREMTIDGSIPKMWGRLMGEGLLSKIPNRVGSEVIALYTDYRSDKDGEYTYVLGAKVSSAGQLPPGLTARKVPAGNYSVFTAQGKLTPDAVVSLWRQVWALETSHRISRSYRTDYEVHHGSPQSDTTVEVYIGTKP